MPVSPVPRQAEEVRVELQRVVQRWRQLPLDHALSYAGRVRALVQSLADEVAVANGLQPVPVPDCGPATLMDQLEVMVYDVMIHDVMVHDVMIHDVMAYDVAKHDHDVESHDVAVHDAESTPAPSARSETLAGDLASLRRELS